MAAKRTKARVQAEPAPQADEPMDAQRVARAVHGAITLGEIVSVGVLNLVRTTLVTAVGGARDVGAELGSAATAAVRGSIRAAAEIGGDLGLVAKQATKGTLQAAEEVGGDLGSIARATARGAVNTANDVGGDVGKVARRAVEGVVEAGRDLGADVGALARSAAAGAIEAADRIGGAASRSVRTTLSTAVAGVRSLVGSTPVADVPPARPTNRGARVAAKTEAPRRKAKPPRPRAAARAR